MQLSFRVEAEWKARFEAEAARRGMSAHCLARILLLDIMESNLFDAVLDE